MKQIVYFLLISFIVRCTSKSTNQDFLKPKEIIALGALVTEDLLERVWGGLMKEYGFDESNSFKVVKQEMEFPDGILSTANSYLKLFNHGGGHFDRPIHLIQIFVFLSKTLNSAP